MRLELSEVSLWWINISLRWIEQDLVHLWFFFHSDFGQIKYPGLWIWSHCNVMEIAIRLGSHNKLRVSSVSTRIPKICGELSRIDCSLRLQIWNQLLIWVDSTLWWFQSTTAWKQYLWNWRNCLYLYEFEIQSTISVIGRKAYFVCDWSSNNGTCVKTGTGRSRRSCIICTLGWSVPSILTLSGRAWISHHPTFGLTCVEKRLYLLTVSPIS